MRHAARMADWWARAFGLIGIAISLATFVLKLAEYRRDRPRLTTTTVVAIALDLNSRSCAIVTIANDGGADVLIDSVQLYGGRLVGTLLRGPEKMPHELKAHGGRAQWYFDYVDLRQQLSELVSRAMTDGSTPVAVRTVIRRGSRSFTPRNGTVYVNPPGQYSPIRRKTRRERIRAWRRAWSRPVPTLDAYFKFTPEDFAARQYFLMVSNSNRRAAETSELVLMVTHADGTRQPAPGHPPIRVPRIRGRRSVEVPVPFVDGSNAGPGDELDWMLRTHNGFGIQPVRATLLADMPQLAPRMGQPGIVPNRVILPNPELRP
jgi:hypothetical protein